MSNGVRENACTTCDSPHCAGNWCECERAYRGVGEKKTGSFVPLWPKRWKGMLSTDDGRLSAVLGMRFFVIRIKYIIFYKIPFPSIHSGSTHIGEKGNLERNGIEKGTFECILIPRH